MNYTLIGSIAILIWGACLPIGRIVQDQIGPVAYLGCVFLITGFLSLARQKFSVGLDRQTRSNSFLYLRWLFFVLHEGLISIAVGIVSLKNLPVVILINYLWPTAIIICSIFIAGVKVYRKFPFILGCIIVIASLTYELVGSDIIGVNIFDNKLDNIAYLVTFLGAISWGLYCAITKQYGELSGNSKPIPLFQLTLGIALPISFLPALSHPWNITQTGLIILIVMCLAQVLAYYCWDHGMRLGNIVILSLLADFIPWISLFAASSLLSVKLESRTIISAGCLVIGAIITRFATTPLRQA